MEATQIARLIALGRLGFGAALLANPERTTNLWLGRDAGRAGTQVATRGLGARDLVLAGGILTSGPAALRPWLIGGVLADLGDLTATLAAGNGIPLRGRLLVGALALGAAGLGAAAVAGLDPAN